MTVRTWLGGAVAIAALCGTAVAADIAHFNNNQVGNNSNLGDYNMLIDRINAAITATGATGANPTGTAGAAAVNGSAPTFMRSDGAPAVAKASDTVFGIAKVDGTTITASGGVISAPSAASGLSGMTATQIPIAASATTVSSSFAIDANAKTYLTTPSAANFATATGVLGLASMPAVTASNFLAGDSGNRPIVASMTGDIGCGTAAAGFISCTVTGALGRSLTPVDEGAQAAGGTLTIDFSTGNSFLATFGAGDLTIANPTNVLAGQRGVLSLKQDSGGSRVITSWGGNWKFPGGTKPTLTTTAAASDLIQYYAISATVIVAWAVAADYK